MGSGFVRNSSCLFLLGASAVAWAETRSFDGTGNNIANPLWGATGSNLLRLTVPAYGDGLSLMAGASRPNPRAISNAVVAQVTATPNARGLSDLIWQWGQFIDHDLDLTPSGSTEPAHVPTSPMDPQFVGTPIAFMRSVFDPATGTTNTREQPNVLTSFIDGSMVYGSDGARASALRSFSGGRLQTTASAVGDLMPYNTGGLPNANPLGMPHASLFLGGDERANEQTGLAAMHTLWVREHNRWADHLSAVNPGMSDEDVYQTARRIVGAEIQKITYSDWLPALFGTGAVPSYAGYDPNTDAGVATEFSTAAFRIGHTMLSPTLLRLNNDGSTIVQGHLPLQHSFFDPSVLVNGGGLDPILKGLASQAAQEIDTQIVDDVRNFLFGPPGAGGLDLATLNIQRGRDHGLCDYNTMRVGMGLTAATSFADVSSDPAVQAALALVYSDVNSIDPWVGMLAEDHLPGSSVGELMSLIILDQFIRARDGDRFFYLNDPELTPYLALIDATTLGDIIEFNTDLTTMQANVFFVPAPGGLAATLLLAASFAPRRRRVRSSGDHSSSDS